MSRQPARSSHPAAIGDTDAALAAAWRFGSMGHPDTLPAFEAAWQAASGRRARQAEIAATAIVFTHTLFGTFVDLARWIERFEGRDEHADAEADAGARVMFDTALAVLAIHGVRDPAERPEAIAEALVRIKAIDDPDRALLAATKQLEYADLFAEDREYARVEAAGARVESAASPYMRYSWWGARGQHAFHRMRYDEALAMYERAAAFVDVPGSFITRVDLLLGLAQISLGRGDLSAAVAHLGEIGQADLARPTATAAFAEILRARAAALDRRYEAAKRHARLAGAIAREVAYEHITPMVLQIETQAMTAIGEGDLAAAQLEGHIGEFQGEQAELARISTNLCRSYAALRRGDHAAVQSLLAPALAGARGLEYITLFRYAPQVAAELMAAALALGIEVDWVRHVIRERHLQAPANATQDWPWPVRLRALGEFALQVEGKPDGLHAVLGKPLEALVAIVALGGRNVALDQVLRTVWRGKGRVGTENVWYVTLRRLRDLLGRDDAIVAGQQRVGLAEGVVDLDLWRLEAAIDAAAAHPDDAAIVEAAVVAYRGPLLEGNGQPVVVTARERLRARLQAVVDAAASRLGPSRVLAWRRRLHLVDPAFSSGRPAG